MATVLYQNPRAWRARIAQAAIWIGGVAIVLAPLNAPTPTTADMAAYAVGLAIVAASAAGIEMLLRRYVAAIEADGDSVTFTTLTTLGRKQIRHRKGEIRHAGNRRDRANYGVAPSVDNQWVALHTSTGKFAYVLDVTPPATIDDGALRRALG